MSVAATQPSPAPHTACPLLVGAAGGCRGKVTDAQNVGGKSVVGGNLLLLLSPL